VELNSPLPSGMPGVKCGHKPTSSICVHVCVCVCVCRFWYQLFNQFRLYLLQVTIVNTSNLVRTSIKGSESDVNNIKVGLSLT
jgi:hypothetical protein